MPLATASLDRLPNGWWSVEYRNAGSFLRPVPRSFPSLTDAIAFCDARGLRIIGA